MKNEIYMLFEKHLVEGYCEVRSIIGVFSEKSKAEQAIDKIRVVASSNLVNQYFDYLNDPTHSAEYWEEKKLNLEKKLTKKQNGSGGWRKIKKELDNTVWVLEKNDYVTHLSFEEWKNLGYCKRFSKENYGIEKISLDEIKQTNIFARKK